MAASQAHRGLRGSVAAKTDHRNEVVVRAGPCLIRAQTHAEQKAARLGPHERQRNDETRIDRLPCPMGAHYGFRYAIG